MLSQAALSGVYTALVTPFTDDGTQVDVGALRALVEEQLEGGVAGLVVCGTTGEAPTLSEAEQQLVLEEAVRAARGRVPIVAGTGSFSTDKTVRASKAAVAAGADGVMVVMPYYSRPSQAGLVEHVVRVAQGVAAPVVLYNIPTRTGVDLSAEATEAITSRAPNVLGIKDATGNVLRCQELVRRLGDRLTVMSGDDALTLPMMACGARGVISTTSNLLPREVAEVVRFAETGAWSEARRAHLSLLPIFEAMFMEPSPAPVKFALATSKRMSDAVRAPLVGVTEGARAKILEALRRLEDDRRGGR